MATPNESARATVPCPQRGPQAAQRILIALVSLLVVAGGPLGPVAAQSQPCDDGRACHAAGDQARKAAKKVRRGLQAGPKSVKQARKALSDCEDKGKIHACLRLSWHLRLGIGIEKNHQHADRALRRAYSRLLTQCGAGAKTTTCRTLEEEYENSKNWRKREERALSKLTEATRFYEKGCELGYRKSCKALAIMAETGNGRAPDLGEAIRNYQRACDLGLRSACTRLASKELTSHPTHCPTGRECAVLADDYFHGHHVSRNRQLAAQLYERACALDHQPSCAAFATMLDKGQGVDRDVGRAVEILGQSCERGEIRACSVLGAMYRDGHSIEPNEMRAVELLSKSCRGGIGADCFWVAELLWDGRDVDQDLARAASFYERACRSGHTKACTHLASMYRAGEGVTQNNGRSLAMAERANSLLEAECRAGRPAECELLADALAKGSSQDVTRSITLYDQACEHGRPSACMALGELWRSGDGGQRDEQRAGELFRRGAAQLTIRCKHGRASDCMVLARLYSNGEQLAIDHKLAAHFSAAARQLDAAGCDKGLAGHCLRLGKIFETGEQVARNPKRAALYFERAAEAYRARCQAGHGGCQRLEDLCADGVKQACPR